MSSARLLWLFCRCEAGGYFPDCRAADRRRYLFCDVRIRALLQKDSDGHGQDFPVDQRKPDGCARDPCFSKQNEEIRHFGTACASLKDEQILAGKIAALLNPATYVVVNAAIIAIVWGGGFQVDEGCLTQGEVIALVNYMSQILLALVALANLIVVFTKASASAARINEVFEVLPGISDSGRPVSALSGAPRVVFDHVFFNYKGAEAPALSDISFTVPAGSTVGVIGGTGSGKTTLVNLLCRFYEVTKGRILIDGADVRDCSCAFCAKNRYCAAKSRFV